MTLYTVVVCPECRYARVVPRHPKRTSCGRCQSSRQFDKLRHYYRTEDKEAAAQVRAEVQAQVNGLSDDFEDAYDRGVIQQTVESAVDNDDYLRKMGADVEEVEQARERAEEATNRSLSKREVMRIAIDDHGESRKSVREYAAEHNISPDWADSYLDRAREKGMVSGSRDGPYRLLTGE